MLNKVNFNNISPAESLLTSSTEDSDFSIAVFQDRIYLAEISHDKSRPQDRYRIIAYSVETGEWETVFVESAIVKLDGAPSPTVTSQLKSIRKPGTKTDVLYARLSSPIGSLLLRMDNKRRFQRFSDKSLEWVEQCFRCRQLLNVDKQLVGLAPEKNGSVGQFVRFSSNATSWRSSEFKGVVDGGNREVSDLVSFNDAIYAATINTEAGFEIWRSEIDGRKNPNWEKVVEKGAHRYAHNQQVFSVLVHDGALFLVTGTPEQERWPDSKFLDYHGFEIIRLDGAGHWELLSGVPRFSPFGMMIPLSGRGPGFDEKRNGEFKCGIVQGNRLIFGFQDEEGFRLWSSPDGEQWEVLDSTSFSDIYQVDQCQIFTTDNSLVLYIESSDVDGGSQNQIWIADLGK